jgi:hypothetical protein
MERRWIVCTTGTSDPPSTDAGQALQLAAEGSGVGLELLQEAPVPRVAEVMPIHRQVVLLVVHDLQQIGTVRGVEVQGEAREALHGALVHRGVLPERVRHPVHLPAPGGGEHPLA